MTVTESDAWIHALLNTDDISGTVEEMKHLRGISPSRKGPPKRKMSYVPASPVAKYAQRETYSPPPSTKQSTTAETALEKAAKIMEDLQELTSNGFDTPAPPKGVVLPAPVSTLLPPTPSPSHLPPRPHEQQREHREFRELPSSSREPASDFTRPSVRPQEPSFERKPREVSKDIATEDKWLHAAQSLRGRSITRDHPERARSTYRDPSAHLEPPGPGGRSQSTSRCPSPSTDVPPLFLRPPSAVPPSPLWGTPRSEADKPVWDKTATAKGGNNIAEFLLEKQKALADQQQALASEYDYLRGEQDRLAVREAVVKEKEYEIRSQRSESPRGIRTAVWTTSNVNGHLAAPVVTGPGSRGPSPVRRHGSTRGGKAELVSRLEEQQSELRDALSREYQGHETNVRAVLHSVDATKSRAGKATPPLPNTMVDVPRAVSPARSGLGMGPGGSATTERAPRQQPQREQQQRQVYPQESAWGSQFPEQLPHAAITTVHNTESTRTYSPDAMSGQSKPSAPQDDWLDKPVLAPVNPRDTTHSYTVVTEEKTHHADHFDEQRPTSPMRGLSQQPPGRVSFWDGGVSSVPQRDPSPVGSPLRIEDRLSPRRSMPDEFMITIMLDAKNAGNLTVHVKPSDSMAAVKAKIQEQRPSILIEQQHLLYQGREVEDSLKVFDYGIVHNAVLQLLINDRQEDPLSPAATQTPSHTMAASVADTMPQEYYPPPSKAVKIKTPMSSVLELVITREDSEAGTLDRAKGRLGISGDVSVTHNGRPKRLVFSDVQVGLVYTLEPVAVPPTTQSTTPQYTEPASSPVPMSPDADEEPPSSIPQPNASVKPLRELYDKIVREKGKATRGDIGQVVRSHPSPASLLDLDGHVPNDVETRRSIAALFTMQDAVKEISWSELLREMMAHQAKSELSASCWDRNPWRAVSKGTAVEPTEDVPMKHRYLLNLGAGRVIQVGHTPISARAPAEIPVAEVVFRGTGGVVEWVRLTNLRVVTGSAAHQAPSLPDENMLHDRTPHSIPMPTTPGGRSAFSQRPGRPSERLPPTAPPAGRGRGRGLQLQSLQRPSGGGRGAGGRGTGPTLASQISVQRNRTRTQPPPESRIETTAGTIDVSALLRGHQYNPAARSASQTSVRRRPSGNK
eukprot:TRINITY_DN5986_c1_g1_i1.p1 TRINITY_DN5986_c1_g1~~TRINITY_DN5986_c1_g1_i1.p1  ORF type:complete len:1193 (+),score=228.78 TRINITY_DN5986_c1_g1_i1:173-3580(+)